MMGAWLGILAPGPSSFAADSASPAGIPRRPAEPVMYFDLTPLLKLDLPDPANRRRLWDETHAAVSLQGLVNRTAPRLFLRYIAEPDDFWWKQMTNAGGWLAGRQLVRAESLDELLERFKAFHHGAVVWDERTPATANLASTIAGCDDLVCLRYDASAGSLYRRLVEGERRLPVKVRLLRPDGGPLFPGSGVIPDTTLASSGSAKCDAYLWLIERYLRTGKAQPQRMGYYMDGFWLRCWNAAAPENHTLSNHDFVIARKGVLFDLGVWDDEPSVDDPAQRPGTDAATLEKLLRAAYDRFQGDGMIHVAGFVPWAFKYTNHRGRNWFAGGRHDPVPTEWRYAEILSCFNAYMDADALGLGAMANASFYQHYPLADRYAQNPKPTRRSLQERGVLDTAGRMVPRAYVAHYVGDYDAAAWLYRELPRHWRDPARGSTALSWAFNPNLCERFPLGMAWAWERRTTNDFFVAGDSGAGYLNPGYLTPPRRFSGLPSGLGAWERHCRRFYEQWDITATGFVIDGYAPGMGKEGLDAYARFSSDGIVAQQVPSQGIHGGMPFLKMRADIDGSPAAAARTLASLASGAVPRFVVARSILKTPSWYAGVERELQRLSAGKAQVVDLYTLLWLVREYETNRAQYTERRYADAALLAATPEASDGLAPLFLDDGPFEVVDRQGARRWLLPKHPTTRYFYFDVSDGFAADSGKTLEIEIDFLDAGAGRLGLHYDATDPKTPLQGAYKAHPTLLMRQNSGQWRTETFVIQDARFAGRQNGGADFRFFNSGDELLVKGVRVRRSP